MGLHYSYEVVTARQYFDRLIGAIVKHLVSKEADRLTTALSKGSDRVMQSVLRDALEAPLFEKGIEDLCLTFLFPADERLAAYGGIQEVDEPESGRLAVGCVWSWMRCGEHYALFRGTAATTKMSHLFQESPRVRDTFVQIGKDSGAVLVVLDDEQETGFGIWPREGRLTSGLDPDDIPEPLSEPQDIDRYCSAQLAGAGIRKHP